MALAIIPYKAGVIKDDAEYSSEGYGTDSQQIRFVRGKPQSLGGWERASNDTMSGPGRGIIAWSSIDGTDRASIGTPCRLYVLSAGAIYNITPIRSSGTYSNNPFAVTSGSSTVLVSQNAHGASDGDSVIIYGAASGAGVQIGGTAGTATDPVLTTSGSQSILVTLSSHSLVTGDFFNVNAASSVGGVTLSGGYTVYVPNSSQFFVQATTTATSTAVGGGSLAYQLGKSYVLTTSGANAYAIPITGTPSSTTSIGGSGAQYRFEISCGLASGIGNYGYGTGTYGTGYYGLPSPSNATTEPRTWALWPYGENLVANPYQGGIYEWSLNISQRAVAIANAPAKNNYILVTPERHIMALGSSVSGVNSGNFDPLLVCWNDDVNEALWEPTTTNTAGYFRIQAGSELIAGRNTKGGTLAWTNDALYFIRYTNDPDQLYAADLVGTGCGLIGPNAVAYQEGAAFWVTHQKQIYAYTGGAPRPLVCPMRQWFQDNLASGQERKIFVAFDATYTAFYVFFPDTSSSECGLYMRCDLLEASTDAKAGWSNGTWDRTCWLDHGTFNQPLATSSGLTTGASVLYFQERGRGADGNAVERWLTYGPIDVSEPGADGAYVMNLRRLVPNASQSGNLFYTFTAKRWPTGTPTVAGPLTVTPTTQYIDLRLQGRQLELRIASNGDSDYWRLGDQRLDTSKGPRV